MARLFVAVYPPSGLVRELAALPRADRPNVRWVPIDQLHVTLRFFGDTELEPAKDRLERLVPTLTAPTVTMGPRISRLGRNVVCVPVSGLEQLAAEVNRATADLGEPPDPRPFRGHLTLARLRHRAACGLAGAPFDASFVVDRVHLVESVTRAEGAEHATVRSWPLRA
jgi:2'-5' RNA ligase